jgi:hypothetical protein
LARKDRRGALRLLEHVHHEADDLYLAATLRVVRGHEADGARVFLRKIVSMGEGERRRRARLRDDTHGVHDLIGLVDVGVDDVKEDAALVVAEKLLEMADQILFVVSVAGFESQTTASMTVMT